MATGGVSAPLLARGEGENRTFITEFVLLGFGISLELQVLLFVPFLAIYLVTMAGNILIMVLVVADRQLHTPMYFFLGNLSCLEICYSSTILPRLLAGLLMADRTISVPHCIVQYYFFGCLTASECYLLAVMSYDRYVAICKPLHYTALMSGRLCLLLAVVSWMGGFLATTIVTGFISLLHFCGPNEIDHFLCDFTPMVKLSCTDTSLVTLVTFILSSMFTLPPFLLTLMSYICIISTVLRIPSSSGRQKAFSTCSSHLIVVTLYYGTLIVVYVLPDSNSLRDLNKVFSLFYTVLTPLVNPLIYSLRNTGMKEALGRVIGKWQRLTDIRRGD